MITEKDRDTQFQTYWGTMLTPTELYALEAPQKNKLFLHSPRSLEFALFALLRFATSHEYSRVLFYTDHSWLSQVQLLLKSYCLCTSVLEKVEFYQAEPTLRLHFKNGAELWCRTNRADLDLIRGFEFDFIVAYGFEHYEATFVHTLLGRLLGINTHTGQPREALLWLFASTHKSEYLTHLWNLGNPECSESIPEYYLSLREPNPFV